MLSPRCNNLVTLRWAFETESDFCRPGRLIKDLLDVSISLANRWMSRNNVTK